MQRNIRTDKLKFSEVENMENWTILDTIMAISFGIMAIGLSTGVGMQIMAYTDVLQKHKGIIRLGYFAFAVGLVVAVITALIMRAN